MDDQERLRIRKRARRAFVVSTILLLAISAWWFFHTPRGLRELGESERRLSLITHFIPLEKEFARFKWERSVELAACPIPAKSEQAQWAARVATLFGYPVPVFLMGKSGLEWVTNPPTADEQAKITQAVDSIVVRRIRPEDIFGDSKVQPRLFRIGNRIRYVLLVTWGDTRWGVVTDEDQEWRAFFRDLSPAHGTPLKFPGPGWMFVDRLELPASSGRDDLPRFRAYLHDSLVFASPNLRVTGDSLHVDYLDGPHVEFFAAPRDFSYVKEKWLTWAMRVWSLFPLVVILGDYRWYRRVRQLTEPN